METFTGRLEYKNIFFSFVFDGELLKLIPDDGSIINKWFYEEIAEGTYAYDGSLVYLETNQLIGNCNETGNKIVFLFMTNSILHKERSILTIKPTAFIKNSYDRDSIDGLTFSCQELDKIYNVGKGYRLRYVDENDTVDLKIESLPIEESVTEKTYFDFENIKIAVFYSIAKNLNHGKRNPLEYISKMYFEFEETKDFFFLYKLSCIATDYIRFLCNRKNIKFDSIGVSAPVKDDKHVQFADLEILEDIINDDYKSVRDRIIPYDCFKGYDGNLLQVISNKALYMRHLPDTYRSGLTITPSSFVMSTAAFEWEFKQLYPDGIEKSEKHKEAVKNVEEQLNRLIKSNTGRRKDILKRISKDYDSDALSDKIRYICKELNEIITPFAYSLYKILNHCEYDFREIAERLNQQRNNFAHGNLDKEFEEIVILDIVFLERVIYIMQLKRIGLPNIKIRDSINQLFQTHLRFAENNEDN